MWGFLKIFYPSRPACLRPINPAHAKAFARANVNATRKYGGRATRARRRSLKSAEERQHRVACFCCRSMAPTGKPTPPKQTLRLRRPDCQQGTDRDWGPGTGDQERKRQQQNAAHGRLAKMGKLGNHMHEQIKVIGRCDPQGVAAPGLADFGCVAKLCESLRIFANLCESLRIFAFRCESLRFVAFGTRQQASLLRRSRRLGCEGWTGNRQQIGTWDLGLGTWQRPRETGYRETACGELRRAVGPEDGAPIAALFALFAAGSLFGLAPDC